MLTEPSAITDGLRDGLYPDDEGVMLCVMRAVGSADLFIFPGDVPPERQVPIVRKAKLTRDLIPHRLETALEVVSVQGHLGHPDEGNAAPPARGEPWRMVPDERDRLPLGTRAPRRALEVVAGPSLEALHDPLDRPTLIKRQ